MKPTMTISCCRNMPTPFRDNTMCSIHNHGVLVKASCFTNTTVFLVSDSIVWGIHSRGVLLLKLDVVLIDTTVAVSLIRLNCERNQVTNTRLSKMMISYYLGCFFFVLRCYL